MCRIGINTYWIIISVCTTTKNNFANSVTSDCLIYDSQFSTFVGAAGNSDISIILISLGAAGSVKIITETFNGAVGNVKN